MNSIIDRKPVLTGCYPAIVTPFQTKGPADFRPINYDGLDRYMEYLIEGGVSGVVVAGCTGAASVLTHDEQVELVRYVQERFGKRTRVIAGDGANSTREAVSLAKRMEGEAGVSLHLQISPYYNKPSDAGIMGHYERVADEIRGGVIMYSVPSRTGGKGITPDVAARLSEHPHIIGIKEASGNIQRIRETIARANNRMFVISGDDPLTVDIIRAGGTGVISVAANVAPRLVTDCVNDAAGGRYDSALGIDRRLRGLYSAFSPRARKATRHRTP